MIKINDVWFISVDQYNYALQKKGSKKKDKDGAVVVNENGEPEYVYVSYGYYTTFEKALEAFAKTVCRETLIENDMTIVDAVKLINSKYDEMRKTIKSIVHDV